MFHSWRQNDGLLYKLLTGLFTLGIVFFKLAKVSPGPNFFPPWWIDYDTSKNLFCSVGAQNEYNNVIVIRKVLTELVDWLPNRKLGTGLDSRFEQNKYV